MLRMATPRNDWAAVLGCVPEARMLLTWIQCCCTCLSASFSIDGGRTVARSGAAVSLK